MRRFVLFYGLIILALTGLIIIWQKQSGAEKTLIQYQKIAAFSHREMTYTSVVHPLSGEGVVLYGVQIEGISAPHRIDRLLIRITEDEIVLKATDVQILIGQALVKQHGDNLINVFRAYHPVNDILKKPFEALTLLGIDQITGNWTITLRPQGEKVIVSMLWSKGKEVVAQIDATVYVPSIERGRLWGWTKGWMTDITVRLNDIEMLQSYAGYLTASRLSIPTALAEAITKSEPLAMRIELQQPLTIADWNL